MWTVQVQTINESVLSVTAVYVDVDPPDIPRIQFSWNATIKLGDYDRFADTAKEELNKYIEKYKNDFGIMQDIEARLNK